MGITRQLIYAIDPNTNEANTFAFADVPDGNSGGKAFTCGVVPPAKGTGISIMQETEFLGTTSGAALTMQALKDTLSKDGTTAITARAITHRLDPEARADGAANRYRSVADKRFESINFSGRSPTDFGLSIEWSADSDPLDDAMVTWNNFDGDASDSLLAFESGLANWVNIKIEDSTMTVNRVVVNPFSINYYNVGEERDQGES